MWTVWDKKSEINGFPANFIFERHKHLKDEETIFIKTVNDQVTQIEGKMILASVYGIDYTLSDEAFIAEYERMLAEPVEEIVEETIEE